MNDNYSMIFFSIVDLLNLQVEFEKPQLGKIYA